jgi:Ca2+-binding EF-hand superfamily protein
MTKAVLKTFKVDEAELRGYRELFEAYDKDGNKKLNRAELEAFLREAQMLPELVDLAFVVFDKDKSGLLDFEEFVECLLFQQLSLDNMPLYFKRIFEAFDEDKDGKLDSKELLRYFKVAQLEHAEEWAERMIAETGGRPVSVDVLIKVFVED